MKTILRSKSTEVVIGCDEPFVMIGERINPTRRKKLSETMATGDFSVAVEEARKQIEAGAQVLDVNVGLPGADEPKLMTELTKLLTSEFDVPLCFDSPNPLALEAALAVYEGKALINSTTGEPEMMRQVLPLAAKYHAAVIGVANDEHGIPPTPEARLNVAKKIVSCAGEHGIPLEDVIIDPLALTVGADSNAGRVTLDSIQLIKEKLGVNMSLGASNVSFGLPERQALNLAYLALCIARGLTAAITDPTLPELRRLIMACDVLMGHDEYAMRWIKDFRKRQKETQVIGKS